MYRRGIRYIWVFMKKKMVTTVSQLNANSREFSWEEKFNTYQAKLTKFGYKILKNLNKLFSHTMISEQIFMVLCTG